MPKKNAMIRKVGTVNYSAAPTVSVWEEGVEQRPQNNE